MTVSIIELQTQYRAFRKRYGPLLRAAKREMHTNMQRALVDSIAATAFSAGYNTPNKPTEPISLKGWKAKTLFGKGTKK